MAVPEGALGILDEEKDTLNRVLAYRGLGEFERTGNTVADVLSLRGLTGGTGAGGAIDPSLATPGPTTGTPDIGDQLLASIGLESDYTSGTAALPVEEETGFLTNAATGMADRALELGGNLIKGVGTLAEAVNPYDDNGNWVQDAGQWLIDADLGYEEQAKLEDIKTAWKEGGLKDKFTSIIAFAVEKGIVSASDMAALALGGPVATAAYIAARTEEIAQETAEADKRGDAEGADYLRGLGTASVVTAFDKIGLKFLFNRGIGKKVLDAAAKAVPAKAGTAARVGTATLAEATTEGVQEVIEALGTYAGTETGVQEGQLVDAALGGALAGGPMGAAFAGAKPAARTVGKAINTARRLPGEIRRGKEADQEAMRNAPTPEAAAMYGQQPAAPEAATSAPAPMSEAAAAAEETPEDIAVQVKEMEDPASGRKAVFVSADTYAKDPEAFKEIMASTGDDVTSVGAEDEGYLISADGTALDNFEIMLDDPNVNMNNLSSADMAELTGVIRERVKRAPRAAGQTLEDVARSIAEVADPNVPDSFRTDVSIDLITSDREVSSKISDLLDSNPELKSVQDPDGNLIVVSGAKDLRFTEKGKRSGDANSSYLVEPFSPAAVALDRAKVTEGTGSMPRPRGVTTSKIIVTPKNAKKPAYIEYVPTSSLTQSGGGRRAVLKNELEPYGFLVETTEEREARLKSEKPKKPEADPEGDAEAAAAKLTDEEKQKALENQEEEAEAKRQAEAEAEAEAAGRTTWGDIPTEDVRKDFSNLITTMRKKYGRTAGTTGDVSKATQDRSVRENKALRDVETAIVANNIPEALDLFETLADEISDSKGSPTLGTKKYWQGLREILNDAEGDYEQAFQVFTEFLGRKKGNLDTMREALTRKVGKKRAAELRTKPMSSHEEASLGLRQLVDAETAGPRAVDNNKSTRTETYKHYRKTVESILDRYTLSDAQREYITAPIDHSYGGTHYILDRVYADFAEAANRIEEVFTGKGKPVGDLAGPWLEAKLAKSVENKKQREIDFYTARIAEAKKLAEEKAPAGPVPELKTATSKPTGKPKPTSKPKPSATTESVVATPAFVKSAMTLLTNKKAEALGDIDPQKVRPDLDKILADADLSRDEKVTRVTALQIPQLMVEYLRRRTDLKPSPQRDAAIKAVVTAPSGKPAKAIAEAVVDQYGAKVLDRVAGEKGAEIESGEAVEEFEGAKTILGWKKSLNEMDKTDPKREEGFAEWDKFVNVVNKAVSDTVANKKAKGEVRPDHAKKQAKAILRAIPDSVKETATDEQNADIAAFVKEHVAGEPTAFTDLYAERKVQESVGGVSSLDLGVPMADSTRFDEGLSVTPKVTRKTLEELEMDIRALGEEATMALDAGLSDLNARYKTKSAEKHKKSAEKRKLLETLAQFYGSSKGQGFDLEAETEAETAAGKARLEMNPEQRAGQDEAFEAEQEKEDYLQGGDLQNFAGDDIDNTASDDINPYNPDDWGYSRRGARPRTSDELDAAMYQRINEALGPEVSDKIYAGVREAAMDLVVPKHTFESIGKLVPPLTQKRGVLGAMLNEVGIPTGNSEFFLQDILPLLDDKAVKDNPFVSQLRDTLLAIQRAGINTPVVFVNDPESKTLGSVFLPREKIARGADGKDIHWGGSSHRVMIMNVANLNDPKLGAIPFLQTFAHENMHVMTDAALRFPGNAEYLTRVSLLYEIVQEEFRKKGQYLYGLKSIKEFLAELWSNPAFRAELAQVSIRGTDYRFMFPEAAELSAQKEQRSVLSALIDTFRKAIHKVFGSDVALDNALDESLAVSSRLVNFWLGDTVQSMATPTRYPEVPSWLGRERTLKEAVEAKVNADGIRAMIGDDNSIRAEKFVEKLKGGTSSQTVLAFHQTDQIVRRYGRYFGGKLQTYYDTLIEKQKLVNYERKQGDKVVQARRHARKGDPKRADEFNRLQIDSTLAEIDPSVGWVHPNNRHFYSDKGKKREHAELRKRYLSFAKGGETGAAYAKAYDMSAKYFRDQRTRIRKIGLKELLETTELADRSDNVKNHIVSALLAAKDINAIEQIYQSRMPQIDEGELADLRESTQALLEHTGVRGVYFPLKRYGDIVISAKKTISERPFNDKAARDEYIARIRSNDPTLDLFPQSSVEIDKRDPMLLHITQESVRMADSRAEAQRIAEELSGTFGAEGVNITTRKEFDIENVGGQISQFQQRLNKKLGEGSKRIVQHTLIEMLAEQSARKSDLARRGVEGASLDMDKAFAERAMSGAWTVADLATVRKEGEALDALDTHVRNYADPRRVGDDRRLDKKLELGRVVNELRIRQSRALADRKIHPAIQMFTKWGYYHYLASPAYSVVNATQVPLITAPVLAAKFGVRKTAKYIAQNTADVIGFSDGFHSALVDEVKRTHGGTTDMPGEFTEQYLLQVMSNAARNGVGGQRGEMFAEFIENGLADSTFIQELDNAIRSRDPNSAIGKGVEFAATWAKSWPQFVEQINRLTSAGSAYDLYMDRHNDHDGAMKYAREVVLETQLDYSDMNRARAFKTFGGLGRLAFMFKTYSQGIAALFTKNLYRSFALERNRPDLTPAQLKTHRSLARRELSYLIASHTAVSGVLGGVLNQPVRMMLEMATWFGVGDEDDPYSIDDHIKDILYDKNGGALRNALAEAAAHGIPQALGISMFSNLGLQSLFTMPARGGMTNAQEADHMLLQLFGPMGSVIAAARGRSLDYWENGQYSQAIEAVVPRGARDLLRAYRYSTEGGPDDFKGVGLEDYNTKDVLLRAVGLTSSTEARMYQERTSERTAEKTASMRKSTIQNLFINAKTSEQRAEIRKRILAFNKLVPREQRIKMGSLNRLRMERRMEERRAMHDQFGRYRHNADYWAG